MCLCHNNIRLKTSKMVSFLGELELKYYHVFFFFFAHIWIPKQTSQLDFTSKSFSSSLSLSLMRYLASTRQTGSHALTRSPTHLSRQILGHSQASSRYRRQPSPGPRGGPTPASESGAVPGPAGRTPTTTLPSVLRTPRPHSRNCDASGRRSDGHLRRWPPPRYRR